MHHDGDFKVQRRVTAGLSLKHVETREAIEGVNVGLGYDISIDTPRVRAVGA